MAPCPGSALSLWKGVGCLAGGTVDLSPGAWEMLPDTGGLVRCVWGVVQREGYRIPVQLPGSRRGQRGGGEGQFARRGGR